DKMNGNDWIKKSLDIVNGRDYLKKLTEIYPINKNSFRNIDDEHIETIKKYFDNKDPIGLVKECLSLEKFPIDNPYVSILRYESIFEKNLDTVKTIGNILLELNFKDLETLIKSPKSGSRQFGNSFKSWLKNKYKDNFLNINDFKNYKGNDLKFLDGSDKTLKEFVYKNFDINTEKGLDLVFKNKGKIYFGEAKFITDFGGTQTNQLNIALDIAKRDSDNIGTLATIDGIPWVNKSYLEKIKKEAVNKNVLTALLLPEYLSSL
ncbi:MAG: hypothetical protein ACPLW7_06340, partial [Minisyncoccia bacterium]